MSGLQPTTGAEIQPAGQVRPAERNALAYRRRARFYAGLLIFIAVGGLPQILFPSLRARLDGRFHAVRAAFAGSPRESRAVLHVVGANPEPFPAQYEHAIEVLPRLEQGTVYMGGAPIRPVPALSGPSDSQPVEGAAAPSSAGEAAAGAGEPEFRQGDAEKEAYDLLLSGEARLADLVRGNDPKLKFQGWAAARIDEETFWVRVTFAQAEGGRESVYVWQVKPRTRSISPLNYNARSLATP